MRTRITIAFLSIALMVAWPQAARSQQSFTIDDFTTGQYQVTLRSGREEQRQSGSMVGGVRYTLFGVDPDNRYNQPSSLDIRPEGALIISSGLKSIWSLYMAYGGDLEGQLVPMNLDLSNHDRFRINFDSNDLVVSGVMSVYTGSVPATISFAADPSITPGITPFSLDLPFAEFVSNPGESVDFGDIDFIEIVLQSGSAISGNDFAITSITATR